MDSQGFYCSDLSLAANEPLFGTATFVTTWFLLEYTGRWEHHAFEGSDLPAPVKDRMAEHLQAIPNARIQMLRPARGAPERIAFYVALSREVNSVLYAFHLDRYEDLLTLDIPAICAEHEAYTPFIHAQGLFLVCTHGRRDKCCARHGVPVYEALAPRFGDFVWQTSHVGGHRFAANLVCLPEGIYYGRVRPHTAPLIVEAHRSGQVLPDSYRGRSCYIEPVQAAEYFLRAETGETALDAFRLSTAVKTDDERWEVEFWSTAGGALYRLELAANREYRNFTSCKDTEPSPVTHYRLLRYDAG